MSNVISMDPDSKQIGVAWFTHGDLRECCTFKPECRSRRPIDRAADLARQAAEYVGDDQRRQAMQIVIETPSRHQVSPGGGAGAALYGCFGPGILIGALGTKYGWDLIHAVGVDAWTKCCRKVGSNLQIATKEQRAQAVSMEFPTYDACSDTGLHQADAIGLGAWFIRSNLHIVWTSDDTAI